MVSAVTYSPQHVFCYRSAHRMIEEPDLSLRILQHFADDGVLYQSNLDFRTDLAPPSTTWHPRRSPIMSTAASAGGLLDGDTSIAAGFGGAEIVVG